MKNVANISLVRAYNVRLVLDELYRCGTASRAELSRMLNISKPAISDNLIPLLEEGIVKEIGMDAAKSNGGRKAMLLQFCDDKKYIVAIEFNYFNPLFTICDLRGKILNEFSMKISRDTSTEMFTNIVKNGIEMLLTSSMIDSASLASIAIAAPGVFDNDGNGLFYSDKHDGVYWWGEEWNTKYKQELSEHFSTPIFVINNTNATTLGEWQRLKISSTTDNMLYIKCGGGTGAGLIIKGSLFTGRHYNAGEIFQYMDIEGFRNGTNFESRIGINKLIEMCAEYLPRMKDLSDNELALQEIEVAYNLAEPNILKILTDICDEIAILSVNFINLLSMDTLIFGGEYTFCSDLFIKRFQECHAKYCNNEVYIRTPRMGKYSGIQGLVSCARGKYFTSICGK